MTRIRKRMPEELDRRNYSPSTARCYLRTVEDFARYFHRPPDRLGPAHIRQYQAHLLSARKWKPTPTTPASFRYGTACGGPIATRRTADRFASVSIRSTAMSGNRSLVSFCSAPGPASLVRISHQLTVEARDRPAITSLRLLTVLNVGFKYARIIQETGR